MKLKLEKTEFEIFSFYPCTEQQPTGDPLYKNPSIDTDRKKFSILGPLISKYSDRTGKTLKRSREKCQIFSNNLEKTELLLMLKI